MLLASIILLSSLIKCGGNDDEDQNPPLTYWVFKDMVDCGTLSKYLKLDGKRERFNQFCKKHPQHKEMISKALLDQDIVLMQFDDQIIYDLVQYAWTSRRAISVRQCKSLSHLMQALVIFQYRMRGQKYLTEQLTDFKMDGEFRKTLLMSGKDDAIQDFMIASSVFYGTFLGALTEILIDHMIRLGYPADVLYMGYFYCNYDDHLEYLYQMNPPLKRFFTLTQIKKNKVYVVCLDILESTLELKRYLWANPDQITNIEPGKSYTREELLIWMWSKHYRFPEGLCLANEDMIKFLKLGIDFDEVMFRLESWPIEHNWVHPTIIREKILNTLSAMRESIERMQDEEYLIPNWYGTLFKLDKAIINSRKIYCPGYVPKEWDLPCIVF